MVRRSIGSEAAAEPTAARPQARARVSHPTYQGIVRTGNGVRRQAQDPRTRETRNGFSMKWASLAVDLEPFGHVGEVGETCVPDVRRQIQAFPQGELQGGATRCGRCDGGTPAGSGNRQVSGGSLPSLLRPHIWIRVGIGVYGLGNRYGRFLVRQV